MPYENLHRLTGPAMFAAFLLAAAPACSKSESGWKILEHKSEKTDVREFSVGRESTNEFTNERNPKHPRWRDRLEVKLYPELQVVLWTGYDVSSWQGTAEVWYRLDGASAKTIAVSVDGTGSTFPRSGELATALLGGSEIKIGYRQIGEIDQIASFDLHGLKAAIERACKKEPTAFDCSGGAVRRMLDQGVTPKPQ